MVLISVKRLSGPQASNAARWIRPIEKYSYFIGNRTRDLPACSIVSQPTTLPRASWIYSKTCLKRNLKGPEHFSAEARFPFNQGML
jgi:hypothetical protein